MTGGFIASWLDDEDWARIAAWGMNSVRFLIIWEAAQPEVGSFDRRYLQAVAEQVRAAEAHGLLVVLDMHQDLWSRRYGGDGAPEWATYDDGEPFERRDPWWMNYLEPAVGKAFDAFWTNRDGIQTTFIELWGRVAERFRDDPNVVGYDVLNEPYPGTLVDPPRFDTERLGPFYAAVGPALRQADPRHVVFLEPNPVRTNVLAPRGFPQEIGPFDFPHAFAPHNYDPPVTRTVAWDGDVERLADAAGDLAAERERLGAPVWVGEWGLELRTERGADHVREQLALFDQHRFGWALWDYNPGAGMSPVRSDGSEVEWLADLIARPFPARVAGTLLDLEYDPQDHTLRFRFQDDPAVEAPTVVSISERVYPGGVTVEVTPDAPGTWHWTTDPLRPRLSVSVAAAGVEHEVVVRPE